MFGIGIPELLLILVIGLIVFAPASCRKSAKPLAKACMNSRMR